MDYRQGLRSLQELLGNPPDAFRIYEQRMLDALDRERFGSTEAIRAEQAEIAQND